VRSSSGRSLDDAVQTAEMRAVVVHSPLVGPATVTPLADRLRVLDVLAIVPDLRSAAASPERFLQQAARAAVGVEVVIGHSGAGAFLPAIADAAKATASVFVDAVVPDGDDAFRPSAQLLELLDTVETVDGSLAPWNEWWPPELMAQLVPDATQRRRVVAEIPRVPRSFYDAAVPLPAHWWRRRNGYLQLSAAYGDDRARAAGGDWPTRELPGRHLDTCADPATVAAGVRELIDRLCDPG
jgi:hypothetical protein